MCGKNCQAVNVTKGPYGGTIWNSSILVVRYGNHTGSPVEKRHKELDYTEMLQDVFPLDIWNARISILRKVKEYESGLRVGLNSLKGGGV